jgi:micrococcal nuclease
MKSNLFHYNATITEVYNGNTCIVDIDLGFLIWVKGEKVHLNRIHAPEIRGNERKEGIASKNFLKKVVMNRSVTLETIPNTTNKGNRFAVEMWVLDKNGKRQNVNDLLVEAGFAVYKRYR